MAKYNIHGMLVTTPLTDDRHTRLTTALAKAESTLATVRQAMAAEAEAASALKIKADNRAAEIDTREAQRLTQVNWIRRRVDEHREAISDLQMKITFIEDWRMAAYGAKLEADSAAALVDRKYGRRLRDAENEVARYRLRLTRMELRVAARDRPTTEPQSGITGVEAGSQTQDLRTGIPRSPPPEVMHGAGDEFDGEDYPATAPAER